MVVEFEPKWTEPYRSSNDPRWAFKHWESTGWVMGDRYPDSPWFPRRMTPLQPYSRRVLANVQKGAAVGLFFFWSGLSLQAWLENRGWVCSVQTSNEKSWDAVTLRTCWPENGWTSPFWGEKLPFKMYNLQQHGTFVSLISRDVWFDKNLLQLSRHHCCCWASCCASLQAAWMDGCHSTPETNDLSGFDKAMLKCLLNHIESLWKRNYKRYRIIYDFRESWLCALSAEVRLGGGQWPFHGPCGKSLKVTSRWFTQKKRRAHVEAAVCSCM